MTAAWREYVYICEEKTETKEPAREPDTETTDRNVRPRGFGPGANLISGLRPGRSARFAARAARSYPDGVDFSEFLATPITWWAALFAVLSVVAGWIASRYAKRGVTGFLGLVPNVRRRRCGSPARFAQYTLLLLGSAWGSPSWANVQPLIAVVVIALVIVVLVLRGVADNFAASVIIQTRKPVVVGEEITVEGPDGKPLTGSIVELNSRAVVFETSTDAGRMSRTADARRDLHQQHPARRAPQRGAGASRAHGGVVDDVVGR